jgi:serine/threonine protein kinase/WD40 repeat protein
MNVTKGDASIVHQDDELLAKLLQQLAQASSPDEVLEDFCRRHPALAEEARALPRLQERLHAAHAPSTTHPRQLGDFRIIRQMARGGMGIIYEAFQERLKRRVVLKTIRTGHDLRPARLRFLREQEMLARLHQTNIVPIYTADEQDGLQYFVMPYIEGTSLNHVVNEARQLDTSKADRSSTSLPAMAAAWLRRSGHRPEVAMTDPDAPTTIEPVKVQALPTPARRRALPRYHYRSVVRAVAEVAEGLHVAHGEGLLHRDVKPANLMIEPNGKCWIIDFGLAGYLQDAATESPKQTGGNETESLTHGEVIGTPAYMAPEQWQGDRPLDARTDVWGLGTVLYELLGLRRPFSLESDLDSRTQRQFLARLIQEQEPVPLAQLVSNIPADLQAITRKALEKDPQRRYATAMEMANDLRHWERCEPTVALPGLHRALLCWAQRNVGWAVASALMVFAVIAGLFMLGWLNVAAERELQDARRERLIQDQQQIRLLPHQAGWSETTWAMLMDASRIKKDAVLEEQLIATLGGLDVRIAKAFEHGASSLAFHPREKRLLMGGLSDRWPTATSLWDMTNDLRRDLGPGEPGPVAFNEVGEPMQAVLMEPHTVLLRYLRDEQRNKSFRHQPAHPMQQHLGQPLVALSHNAMLVSLFTPESETTGILTVWNTSTGKVILTTRGNFSVLQFSTAQQAGSLLAAGTQDGRVRIWALPTAWMVAEWNVSRAAVTSLAFGKDFQRGMNVPSHPSLHGAMLGVGTHYGEITVWRPGTSLAPVKMPGSLYDVFSLAFSPDGSMLTSAGRVHIRWWDVATGRLLLSNTVSPFNRPAEYAKALQYDRSGKYLVAGNETPHRQNQRHVQVLEVMDRRGLGHLRGLDSAVAITHYSPRGTYVVALSETYQLAVWHSKTGQLLHVFDAPIGYFSDNVDFCIDAEETRLVYLGGQQARCWDLTTGQMIRQWTGLPPAIQEKVVFHPSGMLLAGRLETLGKQAPPFMQSLPRQHPRVYRVRNLLADDPMAPLHETTDFNRHVSDSCFTQDGRFLLLHGVVGLDDSEVTHCFRALDALSGKTLWTKPAKYANPYQMASFQMQPDGQHCSMKHVEGDGVINVHVESGTVVTTTLHYGATHPSNQFKVNHGENLLLVELKGMASTLRMPLDRLPYGTGRVFDTTGRFLIQGTSTGEVIQVDLYEVNRRLAEVGIVAPWAPFLRLP